MQSSMDRPVLKWAAALVIVVASFWVTTKVLDRWTTSQPQAQGPALPQQQPIPHQQQQQPQASANQIEVTEATYGKNCDGLASPTGALNRITPGNATAAASRACNKAAGSCAFPVNVGELGDAAPGCPKGFSVAWRCGGDPTVHRTSLPAEANGQTASLTCAAP